MLEYVFEEKKSLESALIQIENEGLTVLKKAELSIIAANNCIKKLKQHLHNYQFQCQEDEILFFKKIKPQIYSRLIYFIKVFHIESKRPNGSDKSVEKYLMNELKKLETFFSENLEFYQYMRSDMTYLDDKYFVRGKQDVILFIDSFTCDADPEFSTSYDYKAAKILANDFLNVYLKTELALIERNDYISNKNVIISNGKYTWTDSKTALTELIYAIHSVKCINNGNIEIKEIADFLQSLFRIDLGDFYRDYLQIKNRQNQTKFIDSLKTALIQRINEQDE